MPKVIKPYPILIMLYGVNYTETSRHVKGLLRLFENKEARSIFMLSHRNQIISTFKSTFYEKNINVDYRNRLYLKPNTKSFYRCLEKIYNPSKYEQNYKK